MRLVIGTSNEGKVREIRELLADLPINVCSLADLDGIESVEEGGDTFEANAEEKALGIARQTGELVMADDSGLEVDALDGAPGVLSARYAGPGATYRQLYEKLLHEMRDVPEAERTARFRCAVCLALPEGVALRTEGACDGRITRESRGTGGFGYDPVFVPNGHDRTFAEMSAVEKNALSHRGRAVREFRTQFEAWLKNEGRIHG